MEPQLFYFTVSLQICQIFYGGCVMLWTQKREMFKGKERRPGRGRGEREWTTPGKDIGKGEIQHFCCLRCPVGYGSPRKWLYSLLLNHGSSQASLRWKAHSVLPLPARVLSANEKDSILICKLNGSCTHTWQTYLLLFLFQLAVSHLKSHHMKQWSI